MVDAPDAGPEDEARVVAAATASTPPPAPTLHRVGESFALGLAAALVTSIPAALRTAGAGGSLVGGWLASAAILAVPLAVVVHLGHAAGRGYRMVTGRGAGRTTAVGLALWAGLSAPAFLVLGAGLSVFTHHRGLGGATFGALAFAVAIVGALAAHRLVGLGRALAARGTMTQRGAERLGFLLAALPVGVAALLAVRAAPGGEAGSHLLATVVDGAVAVVATVLARAFDLPTNVRGWAQRLGLVVAIPVVVLGGVWLDRSPALARAHGARGGLGPALWHVLEAWTDRDRDGAGARFGGGDCDDGDPTRAFGLPDAGGDGVDSDCDGRDAPRGEPDGAAALAAAPAAAPAPAPAPPPGPPSIVLVTLDSVRAESTSAYGHERPTTPALERLAARGTRFEHAFAVASDTQRALAPLVSGRRLSRTARDTREWPTLRASVDTIAERLSRAGYATAAVTSFTWLSEDRGFAQGFDDFSPVFEAAHPERGVTGPHALAAARALLDRRAADPRPLFLWVHLFDAHERWLEHPGGAFGKTAAGLYEGEVAFVDAQLGALVDAVLASPRGASTAFVVHGSHGVGLGEHDVQGHGADLWDQQLRVPLVVAIPGGRPGVFDRAAVSVADVPATVLELAGAPRADVEGRSLVAACRDGAGEISGPVFARARRRAAVVDWPLKLLTTKRRGKDRHLLFDLAADPAESKDLSAERPEDLARLVAASERFEEGPGADSDSVR